MTPTDETTTLAAQIEALEAWTPEPDDRVKPLLLAEAGRREARDWDREDAENVIAFLLSRLDAAPAIVTALRQAEAAPGVVEAKPFQREERYIVIKRKHLGDVLEAKIRAILSDAGVPTIKSTVVEGDWPEYETVWTMIEERVSPTIVAALEVENAREAATRLLDRPAEYATSHLGRCDIRTILSALARQHGAREGEKP